MGQEAYGHFYKSFIFIAKVLEVIAHSLHKYKISDIFIDGWDPISKARSSSILNVICTFGFLITFLCVYKRLSRPSGIAVGW